MKRKILITGGSGFIGTNLVEFYRQRGEEVCSIDKASPKIRAHEALWKQVDICEADQFEAVISNFAPDVIFHLAARTDLDGHTIADYEANTTGVRNMIEAIRKLPVKPLVIFASSMLVCKLGYQPKHEQEYCPENPYGESKVEGEKIVRNTIAGDFKWGIVRPISIWGPWNGSPYKSFFDSVRRGWYIHPKGQTVLRNYGFVLNTVNQLDAVYHALAEGRSGFTTYLGDYTPIDILTWGNAIAREMHVPKIRQMPLFVFRSVAVAGDVLNKLGIRFPVTSFRLSNILTTAVYDLSFLQTLCPSLPYDLNAAVKTAVEWDNSFEKGEFSRK